MASRPISVTETEAREFRTVDREYTYEELLELFDDGTLVKPLVLRCQDYEQQLAAKDAEIERLREVVRELRADYKQAAFTECYLPVPVTFDKTTEKLIGGAE